MSILQEVNSVREEMASTKFAQQAAQRKESAKKLSEAIEYRFGVKAEKVEWDKGQSQAVAELEGMRFVSGYVGGSTPGLQLLVVCPDCGEEFAHCTSLGSTYNAYSGHKDDPEARKKHTLKQLAEILDADKREPTYAAKRHVCYEGAARELALAAVALAKKIGCSPSHLLDLAEPETYRYCR